MQGRRSNGFFPTLIKYFTNKNSPPFHSICADKLSSVGDFLNILIKMLFKSHFSFCLSQNHYKNIYSLLYLFALYCLRIEDNFECFDFLGGGKFKRTENEQQPANHSYNMPTHDTFIYLEKV